jgi:hypothetical protein
LRQGPSCAPIDVFTQNINHELTEVIIYYIVDIDEVDIKSSLTSHSAAEQPGQQVIVGNDSKNEARHHTAAVCVTIGKTQSFPVTLLS